MKIFATQVYGYALNKCMWIRLGMTSVHTSWYTGHAGVWLCPIYLYEDPYKDQICPHMMEYLPHRCIAMPYMPVCGCL